MSTHPADQATIDARHAGYLRAVRERDAAGAALSEALETDAPINKLDERRTDADLGIAEAAEMLLDALGYGLPAEDTPAPPARLWNQHSNDLGDWCPHSGDPVPAEDDDDAPCPARCRASHPLDSDDED